MMLRGGSFDGQVALAPPAPGALRLGAKRGKDEWTELYLYLGGDSVPDPKEGSPIPVMIFTERRDAE